MNPPAANSESNNDSNNDSNIASTAASNKAAIAPFYYLDNFTAVLNWLERRYPDVLDEEELAFIKTFHTLALPSRALLVRMLMRSRESLRESRLVYAEIGTTAEAVAPLVTLGWVDDAPLLDIAMLFDLLTVPELSRLFNLTRGLRKADQLEAVRADYPECQTLAQWTAGQHRAGSAAEHTSTERIFQLTIVPLCERLRILFFGNARQDWSEFVLAELGVFRYESVAFSAEARAFRQRADLLDYLQLLDCRRQLEAGDDDASVLAAMPTPAAENAWLTARLHKLVYALAQRAEKETRLDDALALYQRCAAPEARARAIRMLELLKRPQEAFSLAQNAFEAPHDDAERQSVQRMLPRLRRAAGLAALPRSAPSVIDELNFVLPAPEDRPWVEESARLHLATDDAPVFYVENTLMNSLFGLLCWEAIFLDVPGAFFHPFQAGPADLYASDFAARRQAAFDACFAELESDEWRESIWARYRSKMGLVSPFVYWDVLSENLLTLALRCIPAAHLRAYFLRMLADVKAHRSGYPDLVQFYPAEQRYRLIEVKGPGDRLQDNQRRLFEFCAQHDLPIVLCHVRWAEDAHPIASSSAQ